MRWKFLIPAYIELNTVDNCPCMVGRSSAGLLKDMPISSVIFEILMPPRAVNCDVLGSFRKLKTELPPRVWPLVAENMEKNANKKIHLCMLDYLAPWAS